eukprot:355173-Chlamydomonas_euryale.AAC.3
MGRGQRGVIGKRQGGREAGTLARGTESTLEGTRAQSLASPLGVPSFDEHPAPDSSMAGGYACYIKGLEPKLIACSTKRAGAKHAPVSFHVKQHVPAGHHEPHTNVRLLLHFCACLHVSETAHVPAEADACLHVATMRHVPAEADACLRVTTMRHVWPTPTLACVALRQTREWCCGERQSWERAEDQE